MPSADAGPAGRPRRGPPEGPSETPSGEEAPGRAHRFLCLPPRPFGVGVAGTKTVVSTVFC